MQWIMNIIEKIKQWNRVRKLRKAVKSVRKESVRCGMDLEFGENLEVKPEDHVIDGPDGARIIVSGLSKIDLNQIIKEIEEEEK